MAHLLACDLPKPVSSLGQTFADLSGWYKLAAVYSSSKLSELRVPSRLENNPDVPHLIGPAVAP